MEPDHYSIFTYPRIFYLESKTEKADQTESDLKQRRTIFQLHGLCAQPCSLNCAEVIIIKGPGCALFRDHGNYFEAWFGLPQSGAFEEPGYTLS